MASIAFPALAKSLTTTDGTKYGYINIKAQPGKPTLLFLHGYPSGSYHWHKQFAPCREAGYGVIAPDLLGYGDTDKPADFKAYDQTVIAKQVMEIVDAEGLDQVVGVGHDWGSGFLSTVARTHASRFSLLAFLSVGYGASQAGLTDIDAINALTTSAIGRPVFGYWYFHNLPEAASVMEKADPESVASLIFPADPNVWLKSMCEPGGIDSWVKENKTTTIAPWISKEELEMHSSIMKAGGFTGPLNWYKQAMAGVTAASEAHETDADRQLKVPALFIGTAKDVICVPAIQEAGMRPFVEDMTVVNLDTSHWVMLEKPEETWEAIHEFVEKKLKL